MAVVTSDFLAALTTNYRAIFNKALGELAPTLDDYKKVASIFNSTADKETYAWFGDTPSMEEWKGTRQLRGLRPFDYTLTNKTYEATLEVKRETIEDDKYHLLEPRIRGLARAGLKYFSEKLFSHMDDGETNTAYDSTAFFADTRTIGASANIDNLLEGAYSGSATEIRSAMRAAVEKMKTFQNDWGKPMNLQPDTVVCAPEMEIAIKDALLPGVAGTRRPEQDYVKQIVVTPWVDLDATDWYILCTTEEVKPLVFQLRRNIEFAALDRLDAEHVFMQNSFLYGISCRFEVGLGDPRTAIKIKDA